MQRAGLEVVENKVTQAPGHSHLINNPIRRVFAPGPLPDLDALLVRMQDRIYPETIPVLGSYWLKTIRAGGHAASWWRELSELLSRVLREQLLTGTAQEVLAEIGKWIQESGVLGGKSYTSSPAQLEPFRADLSREWIGPYLARLLNEWLPAEVAALLVDENESAILDTDVPSLAVGRALERLLLRERLSPETLEALLQTDIASPQYFYPADLEILHDVVLALLGRTAAPPFPVLPATVISVGGGSPLSPDLKDQASRATLTQGAHGDEIHVPIEAAQALQILQRAPLRVSTILVTIDGRWWEPEALESGEQNSVVYRPKGRLRIQYSANHVTMTTPWPDARLRWSGDVHYREPLEIFGREWCASKWEGDAENSLLHLVFSRVLPVTSTRPEVDPQFRRSRPASVDIAWDAMRNALAASLEQKSRDPIEQLRRSEFIPLGRALFGLAETLKKRWQPNLEIIETQLRAIGFHQAEISLEYGRVPWRILPTFMQQALLKKRSDTALPALLNEIFEFPARQDARQDARSTSPSRAA